VSEVFRSPETWRTTSIFKARQKVDFRLGKDQFFPMGDNSPQSQDGRLWGEPAWVERDLLTGKALMVYWPHYWNAPIPFMPNVGRMRLIH
jgi:signal peptidase I